MPISNAELRRAVESQAALEQSHQDEGARRGGPWRTIAAWLERRRRVRRALEFASSRPLDADVRFRAWIERDHAPPERDTPDRSDATSDEDRQRRNTWLESASPWVLVCEEFLDTVVTRDEVQRLHAELLRRGANPSDVERMRALAFRTAGWINFELMYWDWTQLDERDVHRALDVHLAWNLIDADEYARSCAYVHQCLSQFAPVGSVARRVSG
jgi:hypothetical protein